MKTGPRTRLILGWVAVACSMGLTQLALTQCRTEEPAPAPRGTPATGASFDSLYPEAADAALQRQADRMK